ncbi:hypothetical protein DFQ28_001443 [Apophysomyces sp. BC1034]|nr:hypothetical protein DFQ29_000947 [Apophysomyces sp. BC1021]KAG0190855.1 hypothetical protein DFQ28_001443 [Apophysomyces sp. BC1034]
MADEVSRFNTAPIMLRHPSSLVADDMLVNIYNTDQPSHFLLDEVDEDECDVIDVPQNLAPEQYRYEFPPKCRLKELAHLDKNDDVFSFFDESSFTTASTSTAACSFMPLESDMEEDEDDLAAFLETMRSDHIPTSSVFRPADHANDQLDRFFDSYNYNAHMDQYAWNHEAPMIADEHLQDSYHQDDMQLVDDGRLSPLELPAQARRHLARSQSPACSERRMREQSCDSTTTVTQTKLIQQDIEPVGPSSFLTMSRRHPYASSSLDRVDEEGKFPWDESFSFPTQADRPLSTTGSPYTHPHQRVMSRMNSEDQDLPIYSNESELLTDAGSYGDNESQISSASKIVIKLNRAKYSPVTVIQRCTTSLGSDEGYDDEEYDKEMPIESASVFLPLSEDEDILLMDQDYVRSVAATKIQAVWRGYQCRKQPRPARKLFTDLVRMCSHVHQQQVDHMNRRIRQLEDKLREETAMRVAFENAMEDMTILIDKQQKSLYERVEREVDMRQAYENKIETVMAQVQPLEARLQKEAKARGNLEDMMSRVIDQVHEMKISSQQQLKEDAESKKEMQAKLDEALGEIALLKQQRAPQMTRPVTPRTPAVPSAARSTIRSSTPIRSTTPARPKIAQATAPRMTTTATTTTTTRTLRPSTKPTLKNTTTTPTRRTLVPSPSTRATSRLDSKRPTTVPTTRRTLVSRK